MSSERRVGPVRRDEYDRVLEVWERAVRATHHFLTDADIEYFKPLISEHYLDAVQLTCIRDETGTIIGFAGTAEGKTEMLFVDPEWHGRGIGRRLMEHAIAAGCLEVDVNEQNEGAVRFYERLGFEQFDRSERDPTGRPYPLLHLRLRRP